MSAIFSIDPVLNDITTKDSTKKTHVRVIRYIKENINPSLDYVLLNPDTIISLIENLEGSGKYAKSTLTTWVSTICKVFTMHPHERVKYPEQYDKWQAFLKRYNSENFNEKYAGKQFTERQQKNMVSVQEVQQVYDVLKASGTQHNDKSSSQAYLLLSLCLHVEPKRSDLGQVHIFEKQPDPDNTDFNLNDANYIVLTPKPILVMNVYKTSTHHEAIPEDLADVFVQDLKESLKVYPRNWLFSQIDHDNEPYENSSYGNMFIRTFMHFFGRGTSCSLWRQIRVTADIDTFFTLTFDELEHRARLRGHTLKSELDMYLKDPDCKRREELQALYDKVEKEREVSVDNIDNHPTLVTYDKAVFKKAVTDLATTMNKHVASVMLASREAVWAIYNNPDALPELLSVYCDAILAMYDTHPKYLSLHQDDYARWHEVKAGIDSNGKNTPVISNAQGTVDDMSRPPSPPPSLDAIQSSNTLTPVTKKNYIWSLKRLQMLSGEQTLEWVMLNPKDVIKALTDNNITQATTVNSYITPVTTMYNLFPNFIEAHPREHAEWVKYHKFYMNKVKESYNKSEWSEREKKILLTWHDVQHKYCELYHNHDKHKTLKSSMEYMLFSTAIHIRSKRSDLGAVRIYKEDPDKNTENYIVLTPEPILVMNVYKTQKVYQKQKEPLNRMFVRDLIDSMRAHPRRYLFMSITKKEPYINNSYGAFFRRTFDKYLGKKMGPSLWRHVQIMAEIDFNNTPWEKLQEEARLRLHSVEMQLKAYRKIPIDKNEREAFRRTPAEQGTMVSCVVPPKAQSK